jgi:nucleotide-binding universal stress UspA family protein
MFPIKTILHPTDFSDSSEAAFKVACGLARDHNGRVVVLHVVPPPISHGEEVARRQDGGYHEDLWRMLEGMRPAGDAPPVGRRLEDGHPVEVILRVAREEKADLIALGTAGRTGLGRLLLGSVAEQVLRQATCPVLTVKAGSSVPVPDRAAGG